jgi:alkanesulfonate monooxygenase SsuD/methylene tetrahydromethanopterin reductase-like flavin-dependent oxidoreductase (luciferase family)
VWVGVRGTPQSFARAGTLGLPLMVAIIGGEIGRFRPLVDLYRPAGAAAGHAPGSLTPRFDIAYRSDTYSNPANNPLELIPSYTLANARLTWRNEGEDLEIWGDVTNLFEEYYFPNVFDNSPKSRYATRQIGRPRERAVTVKKQF